LCGLVCLNCVGCANYHSTGPEEWWHETVGGKIAQQRPPPPGDKDPFPNLATIPPKPAAIDTAAWNRMTAGLLTDRINARQAAALTPIPAPGPASGQVQPAPGAQQPGASAALVGASAPPAPHPAVLPPSAPPARPTPTLANAAQSVANGQLPPLPTQEPPRPNIAPAPPPSLVAITATPPPAVPRPVGGSEVDFDRGSAALLDPALAEVKSLAATRGDRGIAITGYGDTTTSDAIGQEQALGLGLARAQSLATALVAQGVPFARLRLNAESAGRGASLRLLQ